MNESSGLFAAAEVGNAVDKEVYAQEVEVLRVELLNQQYDLRGREFSVVLLIAGDDRPGAVDLLRTLHEWMDARYLQNHVAFSIDHTEDDERPVLGRYWRRLPPAGQIGLFLGGWPTSTLRTALEEDQDRITFDAALRHLFQFEKALVDDGTLVLKFWLHLPRGVLIERIEAARKDPETYWDFAQHDWEVFEHDGRAFDLIEQMVLRTNSVEAPWHIIESTDARYRNLSVGRTIAKELANRLVQPAPVKQLLPFEGEVDGQSLLDQIDLTASLDAETYEAELTHLQARINRLAHAASNAGISCVFVFEGVDAAGKGGAIRRLVKALPIQHIRVIPISAPNEAERARHYFWRFWTRVPKPGKTVVFDRSWYGRVLVERVEGLITPQEWQRAYDEINEFEATLVDNGILLAKFWLQISEDAQMKRFEARAETPYKKYKLTPDDFRNRENWHAYQVAAHDMVARTSTMHAPWTLIGANDKRHARIEVLKTVADLLAGRVEG